jgi:hypothetical protein
VIKLLNIGDLRNLCNDKIIAVTKHAKNRLAERNITIDNIKNAIMTGEIIEQYENDNPFPSCLLLGETEQNKYLHVVASIDNGFLYIITAYYPDENEWEINLKTRKEH